MNGHRLGWMASAKKKTSALCALDSALVIDDYRHAVFGSFLRNILDAIASINRDESR